MPPAALGLNLNLDVNVDLNQMVEQIRKALSKLDPNRFRDLSDTWLFFAGNNATLNICGSLPRFDSRYPGSYQDVVALGSTFFVNDEARSVLVQNAKAGDALTVFDNPSGTTDDDHAAIRIKRDVSFLVIGTFEQNYDCELYTITWRRKSNSMFGLFGGYLDGKISRVRNYIF